MIQISVSIAAKFGKMGQIHCFLREIYPYRVLTHRLCCIPEGLAAAYPHRLAAMQAKKERRSAVRREVLPRKQRSRINNM